MGSLDDCEVDIQNNRSWCGLSKEDHQVLELLLLSEIIQPVRMLMRVPVGFRPDFELLGFDAESARTGRECWAKRIDVVMMQDGGWIILELKPYASYTALGQILVYTHAARQEYAALRGARPAIGAIMVDPDIRPWIKPPGEIELFCLQLKASAERNPNPGDRQKSDQETPKPPQERRHRSERSI